MNTKRPSPEQARMSLFLKATRHAYIQGHYRAVWDSLTGPVAVVDRFKGRRPVGIGRIRQMVGSLWLFADDRVVEVFHNEGD